MKANCHCRNITIKLNRQIDLVTSCNCSICHRYGAIWAYFHPCEVMVKANNLATRTYRHGDKLIDFHHCPSCGCTTHYTPTNLGNLDRMAVNLRMFDKAILDEVKIRKFDGADTWTFIDN